MVSLKLRKRLKFNKEKIEKIKIDNLPSILKDKEIKLTDCIGPAYYKMYISIKNQEKVHYWLKGGRGSLKSAFACICIIKMMTEDFKNGKVTHAVALRKVKDTIKDSIFQNLLWAIDILKVGDLWQSTKSPMKLWIGENTILFRGSNGQEDHKKIKSIKFKNGFCKYALYEEVTEFFGMDEIHSINQSLFRGTDEAIAFYMYNPPPSRNSWVNKEAKKKVSNRYVHHSTYLEAPSKWLGTVFINEAKTMKKYNLRGYNHMYMGEEIGEGLEIYPPITPDNPNGLVEYRSITDEEIRNFITVYRGLDFGYSHASCYIETFYDPIKQIIYVVDEVYLYGANNYLLANKIHEKAGKMYIRGDSEDPRTINEMCEYGLNVGKAKKGKDSKSHGIMWVKSQAKVVVDKKRTPNVANDIENYEKKKDKDGNIIDDFPDEQDGSAALRYSLEEFILNFKLKFGGLRR